MIEWQAGACPTAAANLGFAVGTVTAPIEWCKVGTALTIKYKQPDREEKYLPFCGYQSVTEHWLPLAEKHNLECLKYLEK